MKYYIIEENAQYVLYKVADTFIASFERQHSSGVLVKGNSMQETIQLFAECTKEMEGVALDSVAVKYKANELPRETETRAIPSGRIQTRL